EARDDEPGHEATGRDDERQQEAGSSLRRGGAALAGRQGRLVTAEADEQQVRGLVEEEVEQGRPEPGYDADEEAYQRPLGQVGGAGPARLAGGRCAQVSGE